MTTAAQAAGLAKLASLIGRDLQRAARRAGGPAALWGTGGAELARLLRLDGAEAAAAVDHRAGIDTAACLGELHGRGLRVLPVGHHTYPRRLADVYDPPFGVIVQGWSPGAADALVRRPVVAVVGSRRASSPARAFARSLAAGLVERGAVVVSGLAMGIDAEAHAGALDAGGLTVAVLGCGHDHGYPRANRALRARIERDGLVMSEYWPTTAPAPWRFPARNRIVAGLAHAVVVVQAAARSGALLTADFALEQGRTVLAVPGPPWLDDSGGCNELIRMGAAVCTAAEDVVAEVPHDGWTDPVAGPAPVDLRGTPREVYEALRGAPRRQDELVLLVGGDPAAVAAALAFLEMEGLALRADAQRWWAAPHAR